MLGWSVTVHRDSWGPSMSKDKILARWDAGISGVDWVLALIKNRKGVQLAKGGYPSTFSVYAEDVLPLIGDPVPPDSPLNEPGVRNVYLNRETIAQCNSHERLLVEVWDQS